MLPKPKTKHLENGSLCDQPDSKQITLKSSYDSVDAAPHLDRFPRLAQDIKPRLHGKQDLPFWQKMITVAVVLLPILGMITAIVLAWAYGMMSWLNLALLLGGWYLTSLGITIGFHRLLTHGSFKAHPIVFYFWIAMGSLAIQGSPIAWCSDHRKHHQFSDHQGDPHSPHLRGKGRWNAILGFWHAHWGWLFKANRTRDEREKYVPDLLKDPVLVSIDRKYYCWVIASLVIPSVIGGLATWAVNLSVAGFFKGALLGLIWGGLARVFLSQHVTWSINSICHIFGTQDYKSDDGSRNNLFFGIVSHGEGWHNNHHAFPTSARHGLKWWQFDLSWIIIRLMQMCGLVWDVKLPTENQLEMRESDRAES